MNPISNSNPINSDRCLFVFDPSALYNQDIITKENIKEVLTFKWSAVFSLFSNDLNVAYGKLGLILSTMNLPSISADFWPDLEENNIDKIYNAIKGKIEDRIESRKKLTETFIEIFQLISEVMEGFPRFYEMEDCVLGYLDDGYEVEYRFMEQSMEIAIKNQINLPEYVKLVSNSTYIINRLKNFTKKEIFVSDSEYINRDESCLKIKIQ